MNRNWIRSVLLASAAMLSACGGGGDGGTTEPMGNNPPAVATVAVTLPNAQLVQGLTVNAVAEVRSSSGAQLSGRVLSWNSSTPAVATVDAAGVIRGVAPGNSTISVTSEGKTGSVVLTVIPPPVATVVVNGATGSMFSGDRRQLTAPVRDANNATLADRLVVWSSSNQTVASVSASGEVTAVAPGSAIITATSEGRSGTSTVTVVSSVASVTLTGNLRIKVGDSYNYSATARRADGTIVVRPVIWSVKQPAMGTITSAGVLTPLLAGTLTLQAEIDGEVWQGDYTVYDWETFTSGGSTFSSLAADNLIANKFGRSEYARLVFVCSATGNFFAWVQTANFVTQSGVVALVFDSDTPFSQTWDESSDFSTLFRPGNNLSVKSFASQIAAARIFGFAFTEFQASAKAMTFRVTGFSSRLQPLLAQCPSNSIRASSGVADPASVEPERLDVLARFSAFVMADGSTPESTLSDNRAARAAVGSTPSPTPLLVRGAEFGLAKAQQAMRRK